MITIFRTLIALAVAALVAWGLLPPAQPYPVHLNLSLYGPGLVVFLLGPCALVVGVALAFAAVALLFFRKWGQWLGVATLLLALVVYGLLSIVGFNAIQTVAARLLLVVSALAWLGCLLVSRHPSVAARFRHVH